jgi:hypothetical protein
MHIEIPVDVRNGKRCREVKRIGGSCLYEGEERKKQKRIEEQSRDEKKRRNKGEKVTWIQGGERKGKKTKQNKTKGLKEDVQLV